MAPPHADPVAALLSSIRPRADGSVLLGLVGDVHGEHKRPALDLFLREARPDVLLQVGDLQDYRGYPGRPPMLFIRGNHECWAVLDEMDRGVRRPPGLAHLPDATSVEVAGVRVAGAGGAWSRSGKAARRHLTPEHLRALGRLRPELVLTHETPLRFTDGHRGRDGGSLTLEPLRELVGVLRPRIWASGHHHHWDRETVGRTHLVSLGKWPDEWALVEIDRRGGVSEPARFVPAHPGYADLRRGWREDEAIEKELLFPLDRARARYGVDD